MAANDTTVARNVMVIDLDLCNGCGACTVACAVENNVSVPPPEAGERKGMVWMRVYPVREPGCEAQSSTGGSVAFVPLPCQHCGHHTPCVAVCPQNAVDVDPQTGVVSQIPDRCLGCRYCVAACPYHARTFNWWKPHWPAGMEAALNPDVSPRTRGVVEKCNFCHGRMQTARTRAAAAGRRTLQPGEWVPACVEACPASAIRFGNRLDPNDAVSRVVEDERAFRLLEKIGTEPKVYYLSSRPWVRRLADQATPAAAGAVIAA